MNRWFVNQIALVVLAGVSLVGVASAELNIVVSPVGTYYPELPIPIALTVSNRSEHVVIVNSIAEGSCWIAPVEVLREDGRRVEMANVSGCRWRDEGVELYPGASITGRIDIAPYVYMSQTNLEEGLSPGKYLITLRYQVGTNREAGIISTSLCVNVIESTVDMKVTRDNFRAMRLMATAATNLLPDYVLSVPRKTNDPYWMATRIHYGRWLSRRHRYAEAMSVLEDILTSQNSVADMYRIDVQLEMAQCYLRLQRKDEARRLYELIKNQSDVAYGMLRLLARGSDKDVKSAIKPSVPNNSKSSPIRVESE